MARIGARLRAIRQQWRLSLREVEQRSRSIAHEQGDESYQVSASWLARLESDGHELTVRKLIALADIYNIPAEQLVHSMYPENSQPIFRELSSPNATILLTEGRMKEQATYLLADTLGIEQLPDGTSLLEHGRALHTPFRRGVIGKRDRTLEPMIPPGSIVHIDTQRRAISLRKDWNHEFQRPIYFLMTPGGCCLRLVRIGQGFKMVDADPPPTIPRVHPPMEIPNRNR
jgi:transcriptional regulator with XRE-family HTH domain